LRNEGPDQIRQRTFLGIRDVIVALAGRQPLVLVFEDLHWADSFSIDVISLLMQALEMARRLLALAQEWANPFNLAIALAHTTFVHIRRRDVRVVEEQALAMIEIATEHNYAWVLADGFIKHGWAISLQGIADEGIAEMEDGLAKLRALSHDVTGRMHWLAEAYGAAGRLADALSAAEEALSLAVSTNQFQAEAPLYRLKGDLLLGQGIAAEAEACFERAIEIARSQSAKGYELRAATSLARLWQKQGKRDEARALLQGVYGWFTEGFDTADLTDARDVLNALALA
jgi:tetratricopeptide (TPR) repeat protein